jgi:hypothetical protein
MVLDPSDPVIDEADFEHKDWTSSEFGHVSGEEEKLLNMPQPRSFSFTLRAKVDAAQQATQSLGGGGLDSLSSSIMHQCIGLVRRSKAVLKAHQLVVSFAP